jgi:hypothetical protein
MNTFKFPDVTPPASVETLDAARDALDRANQQLLDAAVRHAALEQAAAELAQSLGRLLAVAEDGHPARIKAAVTAMRQHYSLDQPRTH